jgi:hypothetical protein
MFNEHREKLFREYNRARRHFIAHHQDLIALERYFSDALHDIIGRAISDIARDYNEACSLFPFWQNYPPDQRGRQPRGDQYPWIEVGEHAIGGKLPRLLQGFGFGIRDAGLPTGPDGRYVLKHRDIAKCLGGFTDSAWLFVDIKSVGPRDNFEHTVMSHNQVSGDGRWENAKDGVKNTVMKAAGARTSHLFHCSLPPLYVLSDSIIAPVVLVVLKPVYRMLSLNPERSRTGQPLQEIKLVSIPNGLLLEVKPAYLRQHPGLLYPGKDDKSKKAEKVRTRISFPILQTIDNWRVRAILAP